MSSGVKFRETYGGHDDVAELSRATFGGGTGGGVVHVELPAAAGISPCVSV